jgi:hypothetical protein
LGHRLGHYGGDLVKRFDLLRGLFALFPVAVALGVAVGKAGQ